MGSRPDGCARLHRGLGRGHPRFEWRGWPLEISGASNGGCGMQVSLHTRRRAHDHSPFVQPVTVTRLGRAACGFAPSNESGHGHTITLPDGCPTHSCSDMARMVTSSRDDGRAQAYDVNDA